jgi:hypothetical protein
MGIWYLWSGRNSANVTGAASAELIGLIKDARAKLDAIDVDAINQRVKDLGATQAEATGAVKEVKGLIADLRPNLNREFDDLHATHGTINAQLAGFGKISDTLARQINQEGDTANGLIKHADDGLFGQDGTLPRLNKSVDHLNDIATDAKKSTARLPGLVDDIDGTIKNTNDTILRFGVFVGERKVDPKTGFVSGSGLIGVGENLNGITGDARLYVHQTLFPAPPHGILGWGKTIGLDVLKAAPAGITLYRLFTSTPVNVTNPLSVKPASP